ncbi:MAG: thioesterase [Bacteroidetes bacterium]|nr:MAG: thioesterase [Bacteroidota bacterium]
MAHKNHPPAVRKTLKQLNGWRITAWLFWKLPMAFFLGVRVKSCTPDRADVTLPFWWMSQNPFRSIYFAAQCSAAELSTGVLATLAIAEHGNISMLVSRLEVEYTKKATSRTTFTCEDGQLIFEAVQKAIDTGEGQTITITSTGRLASGEVVSLNKFTWSFRVRGPR